MKKEYKVPEITLIEFTAKDMITDSLMGDGFSSVHDGANVSDEEHSVEKIFGWH